jgi:hypothetical protein
MQEAAQLTFQTAFDLYQKQSTSLDQLWNFYATVAVALLTAVVASDKLKATRTGMYVIVGGFLFFAVSNAIVVLNTHGTMSQLADLTNTLAATAKPPIPVSLTSSPWWGVLFFHAIADIAFVLAMWIIYRSSHKGGNA